MDADSGMVLLLLFLGAILSYLFFSKGFWLDKWARDSKDERESWNGSDMQPDYNTNQQKQSIHEAISQEKVPFTPSLDIPFDDPEVPNRPSKKSKKKTATNRNVGPVNGRRKGKKKRSKKK